MRLFLIILIACVGLVPPASFAPAAQSTADLKKPFLVVERSFPVAGTVHKACFFYDQVPPEGDFSEVKDPLVLSMNQESESVLKEFERPRARSVINGEDFSFGAVLFRLITHVNRTFFEFKKSNLLTAEMAVKFDFASSAKATMAVIHFKKIAGKITADVKMYGRLALPAPELVNFLQVLFCDDSIATKTTQKALALSPGVSFVASLFFSSRALINGYLGSSVSSPQASAIKKINKAYPGVLGEFKPFLGTSIMWAKHAKNPKIAVFVLVAGDPVESLCKKIKTDTSVVGLRGVEHYYVLNADPEWLYSKFYDFIVEVDKAGLAFPNFIHKHVAFETTVLAWDFDACKSEKSLLSSQVCCGAVCTQLKTHFPGIKNNGNAGVFKHKGFIFGMRFICGTYSEKLAKELELQYQDCPHGIFLVSETEIPDSSPLVAQTKYTKRSQTVGEKNFVFYDALFVIYKNKTTGKLVLIADGTKEEYADFVALINGMALKVVDLANKSQWLNNPQLSGKRDGYTISKPASEPHFQRRQVPAVLCTSGEVFTQLCERLNRAEKKTVKWSGDTQASKIEVTELSGAFTDSDLISLEKTVRASACVRALVCNLSILSSEKIASLKGFLSKTSDIVDRYKVFVIKDTFDCEKHELVKRLTCLDGPVPVVDPAGLRARRNAYFGKSKSEEPVIPAGEPKIPVGEPKIPVGEQRLLDPGTPWDKNICLLIPDSRVGAKGLVDQIVRDCTQMLTS